MTIDDDGSVEPMVRKVMGDLQSTPQGCSKVQAIGDKDVELTKFQRSHDVSDEIVEAAIKEWVITNNRNFEWNLEQVKSICLRNKSGGIPKQYLPESAK